MINFNPEAILNYCGPNSYSKGRSCASFDVFDKVFVQGNVIFGLYHGSVGLYRVNIIFDQNTPTYAWCTCPAMGQYDEKCKHIAGLMLLWHASSKEFVVLNTWRELLGHYDKEALLELITHAASRSIDMTNALYGELKGNPILDAEDSYDAEDSWE